MGARRVRWTAVFVGGALVVAAACSSGGSSKATTTTAALSTSSSSTTATTALSTSTTAHATTTVPKELTLTRDAIGTLRIGMTYDQASGTGLIGPFGSGCEIASPVPVDAKLKAPAVGDVTGMDGSIMSVSVRSGYVTSPGGIRNGATLAQVQAAFTPAYVVQVDKTQEQTFDLWFVNVLDAGKQMFAFGVDPKTQRVTEAAIPDLQICE